MNAVYLRVVVFALTSLLALIPAAWAGYGITFDGDTLRLDLGAMVESLVVWVVALIGLPASIFAMWGTGGSGGLKRVVLYVLAPLPPLIAAVAAGWGVTLVDGWVVLVQIEALAVAFVAGSGLSLGILQRWGVR